MNIKSVFGQNLKYYRKIKRLSQEQLSEIVDISVKHLSSIERGLTFVSADLLEKLALSINIPIFCLFMDKKEILFNDSMLDTIETIIEKHFSKAMRDIKSDFRQNQQSAESA